MSTIDVTYENDDGEEITLTLPAKKEVCSRCDGEGTTLCPGMEGHAYTAAEFEESFDDEEDRSEYFRHGGKYDVTCADCKGANVISVIDSDHIPENQKEEYKVFLKFDRLRRQAEADDRAEAAAERRMGC